MDATARIEQSLEVILARAETPGSPPKLAAALRYAVFPGGARVRTRPGRGRPAGATTATIRGTTSSRRGVTATTASAPSRRMACGFNATNMLALLRCPAQVSTPLQQAIQRLCRGAFQVLACRDWCRIDVRLGVHGQPSILEVNPLPGILPDGDGADVIALERLERDGLAVALGQRPQALLTMLYRSTDRLCRAGAPVKNLAHSASLHAGENGAPSNPGIKQLGRPPSFCQVARPKPTARCCDQFWPDAGKF